MSWTFVSIAELCSSIDQEGWEKDSHQQMVCTVLTWSVVKLLPSLRAPNTVWGHWHHEDTGGRLVAWESTRLFKSSSGCGNPLHRTNHLIGQEMICVSCICCLHKCDGRQQCRITNKVTETQVSNGDPCSIYIYVHLADMWAKTWVALYLHHACLYTAERVPNKTAEEGLFWWHNFPSVCYLQM